ncbi:DUF3800 domain-containing protein [Thermus scotoductus]|uniref:DUF3800 domain-containing protein n=1 Tax=Thermus scotoductus TaxID=37636 RepID=A0A430UJL6_THESC|nr:DUF3800 domain-containing protein [Thermus scotoductus]RTI03181.1 DUF3800 domain-containing protein [Thermus scotoductus]
MSPRSVTHVGFSDESNWNKGRFRSLGLVSCALSDLPELNAELNKLLEESGVSEFKWKELDGAKERFAAEKMCEFAVRHASAGRLRVDVLIWDTHDSRHNVPGRDDIANLQRMYYHLFKNVLRTRWPDNAVWRLHPDEHTALDWESIEDYLDKAGDILSLQVLPPDLTQPYFRIRLRREFRLEEIQPVSSTDYPLLQLADLFAGLAVFSRDKFDEYQKWLNNVHGLSSLFPDSASLVSTSKRMKERFKALKGFNDLCKEYKMGVSLKKYRGLQTPNPKNPLNFWMYTPQHPNDKAPRRF